ncbi:MAG: hypothetical protein AAF664_22540 [Planctomycetota bacterium]
MVFSITSLQKHLVWPSYPRSIYFNDHVFVGYVAEGLIELAVADPDLGAVFCTFDPSSTVDVPNGIDLQANRCLGCHGAARTDGVPGFQVRSVFSDSEGVPVICAGSKLTTYASPLSERWGGWYVTGSHGDQHHLGGSFLRGKKRPIDISNSAGENQLTLPEIT